MRDSKQLVPHTVNLETPHYLVRTVEVSDSTDGWTRWMKDPVAARNLNAKPVARSAEDVRTYIGTFNRTTSHLLGIFERATGQLVGIRAIYADPTHREFLINTLIGEPEARNKGARSETRDAVFRYLFEAMDLENARCAAVSTNETILKALYGNGWVCERREPKRAASGEGFVELLHFRLTRAVWRERDADKARRATAA